MYRLTAIAILFFAQFVLAQNTADQINVFPDKTYRGSFKSVNQVTETVSVTSDAIKNDFIIKMKNADGQNHENVVCTGGLFQKLSCGLKNLANLLYRELFRVEYAEITWNGKKVVDANKFNRNVATLSVSVKPELSNSLVIKYKGLFTSYFSLGIYRPSSPKDTTAPTILTQLRSNTFTNQKSVTVEIQDVSNVTSTVFINGAVTKSSTAKSFTFDLVNGNNNIEIKSQDQYNNAASPVVISNVVLDQSNPSISLSSSDPVYVNSLPKTLAVQLVSNEALKSLLVNSSQVSLDESGKIGVYNLNVLQSGANSVAAQAADLAGNVSNQNLSLSVILDNTAPVITFGIAEGTLTNQSLILVPVKITEANDVHSIIKVNGVDMLRTGAKEFDFEASLLLEGENQIQVESTDIAGNVTNSGALKVNRDTTAPLLSLSSPTPGQILQDIQFVVAGSFNEPVSNLKINGKDISLSPDKKSFSIYYLTQFEGAQEISFLAEDFAGNKLEKNISIEIHSPLLVPELVSLTQIEDKVIIHGAQQASRPGLTIKASEGFLSFNTDETLVNPDGSFTLTLTPFQTATVSVEDPRVNQKSTLNVQFSGTTRLSGIIRDINDVAIPNVTVSLSGTSFQTVTNGQGAFSFELNISGDQTVNFDGSTVPVSFTGPNRYFSKSSMAINLGYAQQNILQRPIYLTPILLDGTQTVIVPNQAANVSSSHAPGVQLSIPASSTVFPSGASQGSINVMTIPSEKVTVPVPESAVPKDVVSLEPSGLKFNKRVELTLPNAYELKPNTDVVIFSMNSAKGAWEIDGIAKVSSDGQNIKTIPNQGISHFSIVYAVPLMPTLTGVVDSNLRAVDSSKDSYETTIQMPSFKIGESSVSPSLIYKSNWANPTAFVSNYIELPEKQISFSVKGSSQSSTYTSVYLGKTCAIFKCWERYADFYLDTFYSNSTNLFSSYVPTGIKSQFFISSLKSSDAVTGNISSDYSLVTSELFSDGERQGMMSKPSNFGEIGASAPSEGIPLRNLVSYAVELKDPNTNKYIESGVYPSLARYEVQLKNISVKTIQNISSVNGRYDSSYIPVKQRDFSQYTNDQKTTLETQVLSDFLAKDVSANVIVQNKVESESGRGWKVGGYQQILNPSARSIVIEEANGSVSSYEMSNVISTVYNSNNAAIKMDQSLDFSQWPKVIASYVASDGKSYLGELDLAQSSPSLVGLFEIPTLTGQLGNQGSYKCVESLYTGVFSTTTHSYRFQPQIFGLQKSSSGRWIAADSRSHRVIEIGSSGQDIAGHRSEIESVLNLNYNIERIDANLDGVNQTCQTVFGSACGAPVVAQSNLSCSWALPPVCQPGTICKPTPAPKFISSTGDGYLASYEGDGIGNAGSGAIGLNSPQGILVDASQNIYIADFGNNRVRKIDSQSGGITTIAGNGGNFNFPENPGLPTEVSIYHPKQLLLSSTNDLYISTEKGLILKLSASGSIQKVAGLPIELGGVFANQSNSLVMALNNPSGMALDESKNYLYIADTGYHRVVRIDLTNQQADVIGGSGSCNLQVSGDGFAAMNASICSPTQLYLDNEKNLIVQESGRNSIRKIHFSEGTAAQELAFIANNKDSSTLVRKADGSWVRNNRDGSRVHFNTAGLQISAEDMLGNVNHFVYDSDNRLSKIDFFTGQNISYKYSGNLLTEVSDSSNRTTYLFYSGGNLNRVQFPDGSEKNYIYNTKGMMLTEQNQLGQNVKIEYLENNRVSKIKLPDNTEIQYGDSISKSTVTGVNDNSLLNGIGIDPSQNNSNIIDANGGKTVIVSDINGFTSLVSNAMGAQTTINRDFEGTPLAIVKPTGYATHFTYDPITKDVLTTSEFYNLDTFPIVTKYTYNNRGQVVTETKSVQSTPDQVVSRIYTPEGLLSKLTSPDGSRVEMTYYSNGFMKTKTIFPSATAAGLTTTYLRNQNGWVTRIIGPDSKENNYTYDLSGNVLEKIENVSVGVTAITKYDYDKNNRLVRVTTPNNEITKYDYDEMGNLVSVLDPKNRMTSFEYNSRNWMLKKTDAFGAVTEMNYDSNGNMVFMKGPGGHIQSMEYNLVNDLVKVSLPDDTINYVYDVPGEKPVSINNKNSTISYFRNLKGQNLYESISGAGELANYPEFYISTDYNKRGLVSEQQTTVGNIAYSYDGLNRLTGINAFSKIFSFSYDGASRLSEVVSGPIKSGREYENQTLKKISYSHSGTSIAEHEYSYDLRNYPVQKRTLASVTDYAYDSNGQLTQATGANNENYSYDNIGNRLSDSARTYEYDITGQRLNQDTFFTYQYDNNGNLINKISRDGLKDSHHYEYSSLNQLIKVQVMSGSIGSLATTKEIRYAYDVRGRRMQKEVRDFASSASYTRKYAYNGDNIIAEYNGNNELLAKYTHSPLSADDVLAADISSQGVSAGLSSQIGTLYYLKDHINSVSEIADGNGNVIQRYEYSSFGYISSIKNANGSIVTAIQAPVKTSFTYTGREYDSEIEMYFYRARTYDPKNGRFLQQDPDPGRLENPVTTNNKYAYVGNNPIINKDPSGKIFGIDDLLFIAIVAAIGAWDVAHSNEWGIDKIAEGAVRGALLAALLVYVVTPVTGTGVFGIENSTLFMVSHTTTSAIIAGSQQGSFVGNFIDTFNKEFFVAFITFGLADQITNKYPLEGVTEYALPAIGIGSFGSSLRKAGCDAKDGGWDSEDWKCK